MGKSEQAPPSGGDGSDGGAGVVVVADSPVMRRFAERLTRADVAARSVPPDALGAPTEVHAGRLYLASAELAALAENAIRQGEHVCLLPPWPTGPIAIGATPVSVAEAPQRGLARSTAAFTAGESAASGQPLRILYRERLVGEFGTTLVASEAGEPLLATLPRASNRHGYLFATSLQLSVASAQTQFDDVPRLIARLVAWCAAHAEPTPPSGPMGEATDALTTPGEEYAPLVTLALALLLRGVALAAPDGVADGVADGAARVALPLPRLRETFRRIAEALGMTSPPTAFDLGWVWLAAHADGAFTTDDAATVAIDPAVVDRYSALWQLGPRIRRLAQRIRTKEAPDG